MTNDETTYRKTESLLSRLHDRQDWRHDYIEELAQGLDGLSAATHLPTPTKIEGAEVDIVLAAQRTAREAFERVCSRIAEQLDRWDAEDEADRRDHAWITSDVTEVRS